MMTPLSVNDTLVSITASLKAEGPRRRIFGTFLHMTLHSFDSSIPAKIFLDLPLEDAPFKAEKYQGSRDQS